MKRIRLALILTILTISVRADDIDTRQQSDSIYAIGVSLYYEGKYKEAIDYFEVSNTIDKSIHQSNYDNNDTWIASCYYLLGNINKAKKICPKYYNMSPIERQKVLYANVEMSTSLLFKNLGQYENVIRSYQRAAQMIRDSIGTDNYMYGNAKKNLGLYLFNTEQFEEAANVLAEAQSVLSQTVGNKHPDYAETLFYIALIREIYADIEGAVVVLYECLEIYKNYYSENSTEYASSLLTLGEIYLLWGKGDDAFIMLRKACDIIERTAGRNSVLYAIGLTKLTAYYKSIEDYKKAAAVAKQAVGIYKKQLGTSNTLYASALADLSALAALSGDYEEAISTTLESLTIIKEAKGEHSLEYLTKQVALANYIADAGRVEEGIAVYKEMLTNIEKSLGSKHLFYAETSVHMANCYYSISDFAKALNLYEIAEPIYKDCKHPNYAALLNDISFCYFNLSDMDKAVAVANEALSYMRANKQTGQSAYLDTYNNLSTYYLAQNRFYQGINMKKEALDIAEERYGKNSEEYLSCLSDMASLYHDEENYAEAVRLQTEVLKLAKKLYGIQSVTYCVHLGNLASYKLNVGQIEEAFALINESMDILNGINSSEEIVLAQRIWSLSIMGDCHRARGDYNEAIKVYAEAKELVKDTEYAWGYGSILNCLGQCYSELGNYDAALSIMRKLLEHTIETEGAQGPNHAVALTNLAIAYYNLKNYDEALDLINSAAQLVEVSHGKHSIHYAGTHNVIANIYSRQGKYEEALSHCREALDIISQTYGKKHPKYADNLCLMQLITDDMGSYELSAQYGEEALQLIKSLKGAQSDDYFSTSRSLTKTYAKMGRIKEVERMTMAASTHTAERVRNMFSQMTSYERSVFWNTIQEWFNKDIHQLVAISPTAKMLQSAYDAVLLSKGLLLNSDIEFSKLIQESGDSIALELYNDMKAVKLQANRLREKLVEERYADVDSLERVAARMEKALVERSKVYGDYTANLVITWQQVQQHLGEEDMAVEFVSFPAEEDSTMYVAYVLRQGWSEPKIVSLFEAGALTSNNKTYYTTDSLSRLVWKPLDEWMQGVKHVYFSPCGEFYNIAIESALDYKTGGKTYMNEREGVQFYRLSSTRELALRKEKKPWQEGTVYGGLNYNLSGETIIANSVADSTRSATFDWHYDDTPIDSLLTKELRGVALQYLKGTKAEADSIYQYLTAADISTALYSDSLGTETSFKNLSGKRKNVLHIATHGFYWTERQVKMSSRTQALIGFDNSARYVEDKSLTRSGLMFSGANYSLRGNPLPEGIDNGVLTAKEITSIDLRDLDLVVLSACQTGLGEVSGDGVFGLQRGFKKAGAQTLLMSLWNVDDAATQLFMTQFFARMQFDSAGRPLNKHAAFTEAQSSVRDYTAADGSHPFSSPDYWAAFVLLDAY